MATYSKTQIKEYLYLNVGRELTVDDLLEEFPYSGKNPGRNRLRMAGILDEWWDELQTTKPVYRDAPHEEEFEEEDSGPVINGTLLPDEDTRLVSTDKTFILTCAQSNTLLNDKFWATLQVIAEDLGASIHVSRFTYNKASNGKRSVKPGSNKQSDTDDVWFDPRIEPYASDESLQLAPGLVWCGDLNLSPTLVNPTTSLDNIARGASVIAPNVKMALRSVPTMKDEEPRYVFTTGTITQRNYIQKRAGQLASLHHVYGAMLVEVDDDGTWWARQLNADKEGNVYDKTTLYTPTGIDPDQHRVRVMVHGDIHGNKMDLDVMRAASDAIDVLYPHNQIFEDIIDFQPRNHHNIKDPHFRHEMYVQGIESVESEFSYTAKMVGAHLARPDTAHWIITSNHDQAIEGWLRNIDGFSDPINQELWLELNHMCAVDRKAGAKPRPFAELIKEHLPKNYRWHVVHEDESLMIGGIENGLHGHLGPNGARGTPKNLRAVGKANTAHTHSIGIVDGVYTTGVYGNLDMGYNKGLSSWSHAFIAQYKNNKRAIYTYKKGRFWR